VRVLALGPLEIEGAVLRALSAAKHRALLTILLINANRVVTLGSLIDELWETPPPTATNLVRQYVSHLRRSLTELGAAGVELRTHACGYTLLVSARTSDVADFEELLRQGRTHLDAGRPDRAADLVGAALALWRGPPTGWCWPPSTSSP
jgi:DNA-binding SARP family transcriptional activator